MSNLLIDKRPDIARQWHESKNVGKTLEKVTYASNKKFWWACENNHEWEASANKRTAGRGCPYCSGNKVWEGFNDLGTTNPGVTKFWNNSRNEIKPTEVTKSSRKKVWWRGDCGHEWESPVQDMADRSLGKSGGCPYCSGKKILRGFNDLSFLEPGISKEWSDRNKEKPYEVSVKSNKIIWWECEEGHEWKSTVNNRTRKVGGNCPYCSGKIALLGVNDLKTTHPEIAEEYSEDNETPIELITKGHERSVKWICKEGHTWSARVYNRTRGTGCPQCSLKETTSLAEKELTEYISGLGVGVKPSDREVLEGQELDILVPDKKVAFEFNGLYWHSEKFLPENYHRDKSLKAWEKGVQLIHIWEDDWNNRKEVVKRMVARKLGVSQEKKHNARELKVEKVDSKEARNFLDSNHIQGFTSGSWYGSLQKNGETVALIVFQKTNRAGEYYLERYATSGIVRGGFSKLFSRFVKENNPRKVITFSDLGVSDGSLYENLGFELDGEIKPDYKYLVGQEREHKFRYRKRRFLTDPRLNYEEGRTERELAEMNGLFRIYDAGKTRWAWSNIEV